MASGSTSTWYWRTNPPTDATSATPSADSSQDRTYQSWTVRSSSRSQPPAGRPWGSRPSSVYQKICPSAVASGPSVGCTPAGSVPAGRLLSFSSTRVRDQ